MKRRTFTFGLAAAAAAPALPALPALGPSPAALGHLKTASLIARSHNSCSPQMLARLLKVDAGLASDVHRLLFERGIITSSGANGIALATHPTNTNCVPIQALRKTNFSSATKKIKTRLENWLDETSEARSDKSLKDDQAKDNEQVEKDSTA